MFMDPSSLDVKCSKHSKKMPCGFCDAESDHHKKQYQKDYDKRMKELKGEPAFKDNIPMPPPMPKIPLPLEVVPSSGYGFVSCQGFCNCTGACNKKGYFL